MKHLKKGLFITFEGSEGSGKSTQSRMLSDFLIRKGFNVLNLRDPGSTELGEALRKILLRPGKDLSAACETSLYMAARAQMVDDKILPALKKQAIVICDRFADATVCYQGYGLGVDLKLIDRLNRFVTKTAIPDITFFLDLGIKKGLMRCRKAKGFSDRIERRDYGFHERVRNGYLMQSRRFPRRIKRIVVDGKGIEEAQEAIREVVLKYMGIKWD